MSVEPLQDSRDPVGREAAGDGKIPIQDKFNLRVLFPATQQTGTGVELQTLAFWKGQVGVHRGAAGRLLVHVQLGQDPQEGGLDEGDPRDVLQPQGLAGDGVDVPQTDALKKSGLIFLFIALSLTVSLAAGLTEGYYKFLGLLVCIAAASAVRLFFDRE